MVYKDYKEGDSLIALLGDNDGIQGRKLDADGNPYAEYSFVRLRRPPQLVQWCNPDTFQVKTTYCNLYKLVERKYGYLNWHTLEYYWPTEENAYKAYDRAMSIL